MVGRAIGKLCEYKAAIKEFRGVSGIYAILNELNQKVYVGSSANLYFRWRGHYWALREGVHHSPHFQRAWVKHGESAFVIYLLELCDKSKLFETEQKFLDQFKSFRNEVGYNVQVSAGTNQGLPWKSESRPKRIAGLRAAAKRKEISANWIHPRYGRFFGGVNALVHEFPKQKLNAGALSRIRTRGQHHHKGWMVDRSSDGVSSLQEIEKEIQIVSTERKDAQKKAMAGKHSKVSLWVHSVHGEFELGIRPLLNKFPELNLSRWGMQQVVKGESSQHKGWGIKK